MKNKIQAVLEKVRPSLQMDGGDVKLVSFDEATGEVKVELQGHCAHCPMSSITLKQGIEATLKAELPTVKKVTAI
ncbi:MAG: NifU family protein [bacterium]